MIRSIVIAVLTLSVVSSVYSQDAHFTQFYAAPTHLNPAFVGTSIQSRFGLNYRNQWPVLPKSFITYNAYYDQYIPKISSGIGILLNHDQAGSGALSNTSVAVQYAYELRLNRMFSIRPAIQLGYTRKALHQDRLIFGDQLLRDGAETSFETLNYQPVGLLDASSGILLFSEKYWLGASLHHMNEPNEALSEGVSVLHKKLSVHGGARVTVGDPRKRSAQKDLVFAFNYKQQAEFDQLDFGAYIELKPISIGLWYRGLPTKSNGYEYANRDGINIIFGYEDRNYKFGYSIDANMNKLGLASTGGAHEISISYSWANKRNKRLSRRRIIPCAKF